MNTRSVPRTIRKWADAAGIKKRVHPHMFRHSMATDMINNGADVMVVQQILGHSDVSTTQIYVQVAKKRLKAVHRFTHPRA